MKKLIARLWMSVFGWRAEAPAELPPRFIFICAPHTSWWDFPFMLGVAWTLGMRIHYMGKHTLFRPPFGWFMRLLGGIPVDRRAPQGLVAQVTEVIQGTDRFLLGVPPEGTRKKVELWKSGFYQIARAAGIPIAFGFLDFGRKVGGIGGFLTPSGDVRADMERVREFYRDIQGKHPERQCVPRLREESSPGSAKASAIEAGRTSAPT